MTRPRLLDLFCCEGGAAKGYMAAGFDVTGVDLRDYSKRYPGTFIQGDALAYVDLHGHEYDVIHASPPCQLYSITNAARRAQYPDLVQPTRGALLKVGVPYVIENVPRAPLLNPLTLCGTEFELVATDEDGEALHLKRHRLFESNVFLLGNGGCRCVEMKARGYRVGGVYGGQGGVSKEHARAVRHGGYTPRKTVREKLMGITWMTQAGLSQAIPPAYTECVGSQLMAHLGEVAVA